MIRDFSCLDVYECNEIETMIEEVISADDEESYAKGIENLELLMELFAREKERLTACLAKAQRENHCVKMAMAD